MPHISAHLSCLSMSPISAMSISAAYQCHISVSCISAAVQCPSVMPANAHQCHLPVPISAHQCHLSVSISAAYQCPSLQPH
ncbi:unnamed protein product [Staurois parvus]|uniref:Uncharacterized protein n=1 Tax=Staurois parvus TaxID=386267 RepID=A0ABN9BEL9_9NEOB|nr:unnamed protein product [Staurois parvus]